MATNLNILIIHGIGWGGNGKTYARPLEHNIRRAFERALSRLKLRDVKRRDRQPTRALRFEAAYWSPVTQQPQDALLRVMFGRRGLFRRFNVTYRFRRNLIGLVGDVTAYERNPDNAVYRAIHEKVDESVAVLQAAAETGADGCAPLTIIGHSLGSIVGSDYVWDHTRGSVEPHILDDQAFRLVNYIAMGSPMAMYALRGNAYGGRDSIRDSLDAPIQVEPEHGLWLNLYDRQDAIAFPLEPIKSYAAAGVIDCAVDAGSWLTSWNLLSHVGYWRSDDVARAIGRKLALDWARLNSADFAEREYDKALTALRKDLQRG
jgi:hypothetical protein